MPSTAQPTPGPVSGPQDARALAVAVGDTVVVPCTVTSTRTSLGGTTLDLSIIASAPATGLFVKMTVDGAMVLRANPGDNGSFTPVNSGSTTKLT